MIDTHCHLDFQDFDHDRQAVLERSHQKGVHHMVVPSVSASTFARTVEICKRHHELSIALGLHPMFIEEHQPHDLIELDQLIGTIDPIAVGEIGLDFFDKTLTIENLQEKQIAFFTKQLIIAKQHHLPVIIHNRKAHDECLTLLKEINVKGGIIHAFNGSIQHAKKYIELGFGLGFGGMLTFERSNKLRALAEKIPLSSIVLETDAPDMTVSQHKGQRNSPEYLLFIQEALASIKQVKPEIIANITTANARRILHI